MKRICILFYLIFMASLVQAQWTTATLSQARSLLSATTAGTKVFFAGGTTDSGYSNVVDIYDNSNNTWSSATLSQSRQDLASASIGTKVFFAGGLGNSGYSNVVDIYDNSTNTWTTATLSQVRTYLAAAAVGSKVFFAGGLSNLGYYSNVVDIYDNNTNTWSTATLSQARADLSATVVGAKVFFAGGATDSGVSNVVDIYDNSTNTWSTATLSQARVYPAAAAAGTKALFAGGDIGGGVYSNVVDIYDNSTGTWSTTTLSQSRWDISAAAAGTKMFFAGGGGGPGLTSLVELYDYSTNTWSTTSLSQARSQLSASSVGNNVFFAGGFKGGLGGLRSNVVDIYTIPTSIGSFSPTTGAPGDAVTLIGNFDPTGASSLVYFNGVAATVTASSFTSLTATVPTGATTGSISVTANGVTANSSTNFSVTGPTTQTITFAALATKTYGNAPFSLTGTASSGLTVSYTSSDPTVATVSGSTVTIVGGGACTITASQAGDATYRAAADVARTLTINKANQTITFNTLAAKTYTSPDFALTGTASSGLTVTYVSSNTSVATIVSGNTVHILDVGTSTITASQAGNSNYNAATDVARTLTVNKASQTITFTLSAKTYDLGSYQFTGTTTSGLPISYSSSNTAVATIGGTNGDVATFTGVGTSTITASQAGDSHYNAATPVAKTLTVNKGVQTITFGTLTPVNSYDPPFNLTGTASSGLTVSYTSSNPAVATVSGNTVTIVGVGTTNITASQAGDGVLWLAATNVTHPLVVKALQTITFGALASKNYSDAPFSLTATASSGLAVTYASSDPTVATISGSTVTIVGPGTTTITASQAGNSAYSPATNVTQNLVVNLLAPTVPSSFIEFTNVSDTQMSIGVIAGNGNKRLIVIKPTDPSGFFVPTNNTSYSAGYTSGGSVVVMSGTGSITTVTGLTASTKYYVEVFEFNDANGFTSYLTGCGVPTAAQQTQSSGGGGGARMASSTPTPPVLEPGNFDVRIFGNPFNKKLVFQVDSNQPLALITLTDVTGRVIHEATVNTNTIIEIEKQVSQGVYILKVISDDKHKSLRLVKE